ncbi:Arabinanase/levansucrase/invertase [Anaeromyces robustus]|jgi:hypothetical protein|uniref:Arabinanase/levansucrase/invertase n=1 Tax=Anaeromyces robustus TaxID=1754192 RepID=A0A1Y1WT82_9FUNG|nr:Arabinanase/levansucrase/invertase [Anaeromyces robustus]|eukprot:ORX76759.1 Arabinanase/levansucrase/invertase [Anaeromyces robustus]
MKFITALSLLIVGYGSVHAYSNCNSTCRVVTVEDGVSWGVENNDWCIIKPSLCNTSDPNNKCFSYPDYPCCEECNVYEEDDSGKWGIENNQWCGIKDSCFKPPEEEDKDVVGYDNQRTCKSPLVSNMYTADPAPMVYGDTLYLFTSHDENNIQNNFYTMLNWHLFSTKDMINWTSHGQVFSLDDISWADDRAWAPQAIARNDKFYLYVPVHKRNGGMAIAVGVSDKPTGPYKDIGHPLVDEGDWNDIDPTVFIDDDGQAYLYFGNPELRYVLLNEDMVSYNKSVGVKKIPMTADSFGRGEGSRTTYGEGPFFYKRKDMYYMAYAAFRPNKGSEHLAYSYSNSPTGPWKYGGVLMTEDGGTYTNHPGIARFKGRSYLFYHTGQLPGGGAYHRSVCFTEFKYNKDGSIDTIPMCRN